MLSTMSNADERSSKMRTEKCMYIGFSNMEGLGNVTMSGLRRESKIFQKLLKWRRDRVYGNWSGM